MLKLKLQYFGHLIQRPNSLEKTLMLGKIEGRRRRGQHRMRCWMASPTQWTWVWASCGSWWWTGKPGELQSMGSQRVRHDWRTEQEQRWAGTHHPTVPIQCLRIEGVNVLSCKRIETQSVWCVWEGVFPWSQLGKYLRQKVKLGKKKFSSTI